MELAQRKLDRIREAWNNYFLDYAFCQERIHFTKEVATNYFGDLASYLDDTFPIISKKPFTDESKEHLGNAMALLQAIYVQQDLVDELMIIFGLPRSNNDFKKSNRDLRNHLIGHPISRDKKGNLTSTVLLRYDNPESEITYVYYESGNFYQGEMRGRSIDLIIEEHTKYMHRNLDIILKKIQKILYAYRKELKRILDSMKSYCHFEVLIEDTFTYFEEIRNLDHLYKKDRLLYYHSKRKDHPRYAHAIRLFRQDLKAGLREKIKDVAEYGKPVVIPPPYDPADHPPIEIIYVTADDFKGKRRKYKKDLGYELSKLQEKHHPLGLNYLLRRFAERPLVGDELRFMQANLHDDREYYAGYHYVTKLLKGQSSRMFYE